MLRAHLSELRFICPQKNLLSIRQHGILCHADMQGREHVSVAMGEIQGKRAHVNVPGGLKLHSYANLYFHARNPMMFVRKGMHQTLAVLTVDCAVLDLVGTVIADGNASSDWTGFWQSPQGLAKGEPRPDLCRRLA